MVNQDWRSEHSGNDPGSYSRSYRRTQSRTEEDDSLLWLDETDGRPVRSRSAGSRGSESGSRGSRTAARPASGTGVSRGNGTGGRTRGSAGGNRRRRKKNLKRRLVAYGMRLLCILIPVGILALAWSWLHPGETAGRKINPVISIPSFVAYQPLTVNPSTRPGIQLSDVNGIVIHASDQADLSAMELRDHYESLTNYGDGNTSSNFVIDAQGTVICCVPPGELAYATDGRDLDTISVTLCSSAQEQPVSAAAAEKLAALTVWLCREYGLGSEAVMRHYDASGIRDPLVYVEDEESWENFLKQVQSELDGDSGEETTAAETEGGSETEKEGPGDDNDSDVEVGEEEPLPDDVVEE